MDTVTQSADSPDAAAKPSRVSHGLVLLLLIFGSIVAGGAAGALGLLAPVSDLVWRRDAEAPPSAVVYYALPALNVAIDAFSDLQGTSAASPGRHLRAIVQLEIKADQTPHLEALQPRIMDVLLTFLHALRERDLVTFRGLDRLKAQMLHRVRQVTGDDAVHSILITDFAVL